MRRSNMWLQAALLERKLSSGLRWLKNLVSWSNVTLTPLRMTERLLVPSVGIVIMERGHLIAFYNSREDRNLILTQVPSCKVRIPLTTKPIKSGRQFSLLNNFWVCCYFECLTSKITCNFVFSRITWYFIFLYCSLENKYYTRHITNNNNNSNKKKT